jgi:quinol monooxygenase YgiN
MGQVITFIAHLRVKPENAAAFEALITYVRDMTREHEPGVRYYDFARSVDEPDTYVVVEVYEDPTVHAAHMASAWVKESLPKSLHLVEGRPDIKQYVTPGSEPVLHLAKF